MENFNPSLIRSEGNKGHARTVEAAHQAANVRWQTRWAPLTPYEDRLADALQAIFAAGIYELPLIVAELNRRGVTLFAGDPWTEESFVQEMARLAYQPKSTLAQG